MTAVVPERPLDRAPGLRRPGPLRPRAPARAVLRASLPSFTSFGTIPVRSCSATNWRCAAVMPDYRYLIVGGGMTGDAACRGIRDHDPDGSIGLIGEEPDPPYSRPPLSKALWQGKDEASIWRGTADLGVELAARPARRRGRPRAPHASPTSAARPTATSSCCSRRAARPRRLPGEDERRHRLLPPTCPTTGGCARSPTVSAEFVVLGGGFIGSEVAAGLRPVRLRGDAGLPRGRDRGAPLPGRARGVGRTSSTAVTASRCSPGELVSARRAATASASASSSRAAARSRPTRSSPGSGSSRDRARRGGRARGLGRHRRRRVRPRRRHRRRLRGR